MTYDPTEPTDTDTTLLDETQQRRTLALAKARPMLASQTFGSRTPPPVDDLIRLAQWILDGEYTDLYPFLSGEVTVLGPEIFASNDSNVICWKGRNYVPQEDADA